MTIYDLRSFSKIIWTHALTQIGHKCRHTKIHELLRMAEAMKREDN